MVSSMFAHALLTFSLFDAQTEPTDMGLAVDAIYLDFAKAIDTVLHQRLITKLEGYGVRGKLFPVDPAVPRGETSVCECEWSEVRLGTGNKWNPPGQHSWSFAVPHLHKQPTRNSTFNGRVIYC